MLLKSKNPTKLNYTSNIAAESDEGAKHGAEQSRAESPWQLDLGHVKSVTGSNEKQVLCQSTKDWI